MTTIRRIDDKESRNAAVCELLRDFLVRAESGEIIGVVLVGVQKGGSTLQSIKGKVSYHQIVFSANNLILDALEESREGDTPVGRSGKDLEVLLSFLHKRGVNYLSLEDLEKLDEESLSEAWKWAVDENAGETPPESLLPF